MKKLIVLLLLSSPSWGAIAHVQNKWCSNGSGASGTCAFTSNITAGSLIVVGCGGNRQTGVVYSVSDTLGNTYTLINSTTVNNNGSAAAGVWYAKNSGAGANTVTCQDTKSIATWIQQSIHEYSGAATATDPYDVSSSSNPAAAYSTTIMVTSSATTTSTNELMFSYCNFALGSASSQSGTLRTNNVDNAYMMSQDTILASPQTYQSYFVATSNNAGFVCIQVAFKEPTAAVPPVGVLLIGQ